MILLWNKQSLNNDLSQLTNENCEYYSCHNEPIDVVYTWVNGSDPQLIKQLKQIEQQMELEISCKKANQIKCIECIQAPLLLIKPMINDPSKLMFDVTKFEIYNNTANLLYFSNLSSGKFSETKELKNYELFIL